MVVVAYWITVAAEKVAIYGLIIQLLEREIFKSVHLIELDHSQNRTIVVKCIHTSGARTTLQLHIDGYSIAASQTHNSQDPKYTKSLKCTRISFYPCRQVIHFGRKKNCIEYFDRCNLVYVLIIVIANIKNGSRKINSNFEIELHSWEQHLFVCRFGWLCVCLFV